MKVLALLLLVCCGLAGCGGSSGCGRYDDCDDAYASIDDRAEADVEEVEPVDPADVDAYEVESSGFDDCIGDCSGHEAGAAWAQENDLADPSECGGNSDSFVAGCEAFAEDRIALAEQQT